MASCELPLKPLRVVVIEDNPRHRSSLEQLVGGDPDFSIAASFPSAEPALRRAGVAMSSAEELPWDLVLMDLELRELSGIEAIHRLKFLLPRVPIVVLTVFEEPATILQAICAGADGYMLKKMRAQEILDGLRVVREGGVPLTASIARSVFELVRRGGTGGMGGVCGRSPSRLDLTQREQEVLRGLVEGLSYKQTAGTLRISLGTVRTHITAVYRKLHVHSVAEAVSRAIREGIV